MKKVLICIMGAAVIMLLFTGCGKSSEKDYSNSSVTGQVTAVDGSSVTLLLGEMAENPTGDASAAEAPSVRPDSSETAPSSSPSGEAPSGGAPSGDAPSGDAPSGGAPSGETPASGAPSGNAPSGGGAMSSFTAGEESVTITITDSTVITVAGMGESTEGTIDDITVDSILEVSFGDDNTVTSITVRNAMGGGNMGGKDGQGNAANGSSSNT